MTTPLRSALLVLAASLAPLLVVAGCVESRPGEADAAVDGSADAEVSEDADVTDDAGDGPDGSGQCVPLGDPCTDVTECCGYEPDGPCSMVWQCEGTCDFVIIPC